MKTILGTFFFFALPKVLVLNTETENRNGGGRDLQFDHLKWTDDFGITPEAQ